MKKCPNCEKIMNEVIKVDVLIDVCPSCMGIWLDKGELEKIINRAKAENSDQDQYNYENNRYRHHDDDDDHDDHRYKDKHGFNNGYPRKKRGGLSDIFGNLFD